MITIQYVVGAMVAKFEKAEQRKTLIDRMQQAAVSEGANYILYQLVQATPVGATAGLRTSTAIEYSSNRTQAYVGPTGGPALYAGFVEDGTRAHMPPFDPISYWVARVLGLPMGSPENRRATFGVMFAIARRGTKAKRYVHNTWSRYRYNAETLMAQGAMRELNRWLES